MHSWKGTKCDRPCDGRYYGYNCNQKCKCLNNAACNPQNGNFIEYLCTIINTYTINYV